MTDTTPERDAAILASLREWAESGRRANWALSLEEPRALLRILDARDLGRQMAQWCDDAEPKARLKFPELPPRCSSCAFREGAHLASGSPATQMDALKCAIEGQPFFCHQHDRKDEVCSGWVMLILADDKANFGEAPWDFVGGTDGASAPAEDDGSK